MRSVTIVMYPREGEAFHPVGERLAADPDVRREAIHRIDAMDDGTVAMLAAASGDLDRYREILANSPEVRELAVAGTDEGFTYTRTESNEFTDYLLTQQRESEFVRDGPIEITDDGGQRFTLIGGDEAFRRVEYDPPEGVTFDVERMGEYYPESDRLLDGLTDRQREILRVAVSLGYYEQPRQATHEDIAAAVGCSSATVTEHLQKVERTVFGSLVE